MITIEEATFQSKYLERAVRFDVYRRGMPGLSSTPSLLLINDGQDLFKMNFSQLLHELNASDLIKPLICVGIHAGNRLMEYGTKDIPDCKGRGAKTLLYQQFLLNELLPFLSAAYGVEKFHEKAVAGFSLGGLSALDTVWTYPDTFSIAGVFSGSLWWRKRDLDEGYVEERDRIMHQKIRQGNYIKHLRFYFTTGSLDETSDRNNNGIIDSIDDTLDLISELKKLGYTDHEIWYVNDEHGRHDTDTWRKALPGFLLWAWRK